MKIVVVQKYQDKGMLFAYAPALPGVMVYGRSLDEIKEKLPSKIKELLDEINVDEFEFTTSEWTEAKL